MRSPMCASSATQHTYPKHRETIVVLHSTTGLAG